MPVTVPGWFSSQVSAVDQPPMTCDFPAVAALFSSLERTQKPKPWNSNRTLPDISISKVQLAWEETSHPAAHHYDGISTQIDAMILAGREKAAAKTEVRRLEERLAPEGPELFAFHSTPESEEEELETTMMDVLHHEGHASGLATKRVREDEIERPYRRDVKGSEPEPEPELAKRGAQNLWEQVESSRKWNDSPFSEGYGS